MNRVDVSREDMEEFISGFQRAITVLNIVRAELNDWLREFPGSRLEKSTQEVLDEVNKLI